MGDSFPAETPDGIEMVTKNVIDGETVVLEDEEGEIYQANATGTLVEQTDEPVPVNAAATPLPEGANEGETVYSVPEGTAQETAHIPIPAEMGEPKAEFIEDITLEQNQADSMTEADKAPEVEEVEEAVEEATGTPTELTASEADAQVEAAEAPAEEEAAPEAEMPMDEVTPEMDAAEEEAPAEAEAAPEATEAAEELAAEAGINLADVEGSGIDGRITKPDVEAAIEEAPQEADQA